MLKKNHIGCKDPELMLFTIIELINATCYNCILFEEPVTIDEYLPYLHLSIIQISVHLQAKNLLPLPITYNNNKTKTDVPKALSLLFRHLFFYPLLIKNRFPRFFHRSRFSLNHRTDGFLCQIHARSSRRNLTVPNFRVPVLLFVLLRIHLCADILPRCRPALLLDFHWTICNDEIICKYRYL